MPLPALLMVAGAGGMAYAAGKTIKDKLRARELQNRGTEQKLQSNEMKMNAQRTRNDQRDISDFYDSLEAGDDASAHRVLQRSTMGTEKGAKTYAPTPPGLYGEPGLLFIDGTGNPVTHPHPTRGQAPFTMSRSQMSGIRDKYRAGQQEYGATAAGTYSKSTGRIADRFAGAPSKVWVNPKTKEFSASPIEGGVEVTGKELLAFMKGNESKRKDNYLELKDGTLIDLTAWEESGGDIAAATIKKGEGGLPGGDLAERKFVNTIKDDLNRRLAGIYNGFVDPISKMVSGMSGEDTRKYTAASVIAEKIAVDQYQRSGNADIASAVQQAADIVERITALPGGDKVDILAEWRGGGRAQEPAGGGGLPPQTGGGAERLAEMMGT